MNFPASLFVAARPVSRADWRASQSAAEILTLLQQLNRDHGKTVIMVTHDPKAAEYARHILHLDKGTLVESGAAQAAPA